MIKATKNKTKKYISLSEAMRNRNIYYIYIIYISNTYIILLILYYLGGHICRGMYDKFVVLCMSYLSCIGGEIK